MPRWYSLADSKRLQNPTTAKLRSKVHQMKQEARFRFSSRHLGSTEALVRPLTDYLFVVQAP